MKILLLPLEFRTWRHASHWPYPMNLGLVEGLEAGGAEVVTLPADHDLPSSSPGSWLSRAREVCAGHRFDQVWFEMSHSNLEPDFLDWLAGVAPIRVGFVVESMTMSAAERQASPEGAARRDAWMKARLPYATHVLAVDELDVARLVSSGKPAFFWPAGVIPARMIRPNPPAPRRPEALFLGTVYGARAQWLGHPSLQGLLYRPKASPEWATPLPGLFDDLQREAEQFLEEGPRGETLPALRRYLVALRQAREAGFALYLDGLLEGCAVVNLPQFGQAYASRVTEAMAAGRPVLSWAIPDRPRTRALFEDGREILLYDQAAPEQLAEQVRRLQRDPALGRSIAAAATAKLRAYHTSERVLGEVLAWASGVTSQATHARATPAPQALCEPELAPRLPPPADRQSLESLCGPGDLVFDVGANVGAKAEALVQRGVRVICFEPQPGCVEALRRRFAGEPLVTIVPRGVAARPGTLQLSICNAAPTISTFSEDWKKGRFSTYSWDQRVSVDVMTLDQAVAQFGPPRYCKIDVEGFELEVLQGLTRRAGTLSFEFTREYLDVARACVDRCVSLGYTSFNFAIGEESQLALPQWIGPATLFARLEGIADDLLWGDLYAQ